MELLNVDSFKWENGMVIGVAFQMHKAQRPLRLYVEAWRIFEEQKAGAAKSYIITYQDESSKAHSFKLKAVKDDEVYYIAEPDDPIEKEVFNKIPEFLKRPDDFMP